MVTSRKREQEEERQRNAGGPTIAGRQHIRQEESGALGLVSPGEREGGENNVVVNSGP